MSQGVLPIQYEIDLKEHGLTAFGGLPLYLELAHVTGFVESVRKNLSVRDSGWSDVQIVTALFLLNLAGGNAVDDLEHLGEDEGFVEVLRRAVRARLIAPLPHHSPRKAPASERVEEGKDAVRYVSESGVSVSGGLSRS